MCVYNVKILWSLDVTSLNERDSRSNRHSLYDSWLALCCGFFLSDENIRIMTFFSGQEDGRLNSVTQHGLGSTGSWAAAKRGYDTESAAWSQPQPQPPPTPHLPPLSPLSLQERGGGRVVSQREQEKPQNNCRNQDLAAVVCQKDVNSNNTPVTHQDENVYK